MNLEHLGLNHPAPVAAAAWYGQHLNMTIARRSGPPHHGHFLKDARGQMMLELYFNPKVARPDFATLDPLAFHVAFQVDDVAATRARLLQAGATAEGEPTSNDRGDHFAIVRDPWGLALQLAQRATPMI
jgi:glyoxylase I family protein